MKKISKNKKDKILKWAQLGVPNSILSFWFKISVPKIKQIIREENTRSDQSNQNSYDSYLMIAQGKVHSPRQRQPPISLPVVPVNPAPEVPTPEVNTSDSYYYFLWFEEHRVNLQKEDEKRRLLEQHREELQRKDQLISDLTKQLHEKTRDMANLKQENKTLSDQLTKEIKNNAELRQNYDLQLQKTKKDYLFFVEQIKTLRNENDHLKHRVKQSSDMSYPSASNIRQSSPSNDFQNSESKTDHKKSDDNEKENGKPMKTIIHSPSGLKISESNQKNHSHRLLGLVQGFVTAKPDIFKIITLLTGNSQALNNQMPSPYLNNDNLKAMLKGIPTLASILSYS